MYLILMTLHLHDMIFGFCASTKNLGKSLERTLGLIVQAEEAEVEEEKSSWRVSRRPGGRRANVGYEAVQSFKPATPLVIRGFLAGQTGYEWTAILKRTASR